MSQLFKIKIQSSMLFDVLSKCAKNMDTYYIFNKTTYKTAKYHKHTSDFLTHIGEYYHDSKKFYANRDDTYNNFTTVLRQICKHLSIPYTSRKEYSTSTYHIYYHFYKTF
jgi:hypothetical protein